MIYGYDLDKNIRKSKSHHRKDARGDTRYSDELRRRVHSVAKDAGYSPDPLARGLRGGKTHTIGVLWALSVPQVSSRFTRGVARLAHELAYQTLITDTMSDPEVIWQAIKQYQQRRVDGVIIQLPFGIKLTAKLIAAIRAFPAAVLVVDQFVPELDEIDQIERDACGGYLEPRNT